MTPQPATFAIAAAWEQLLYAFRGRPGAIGSLNPQYRDGHAALSSVIAAYHAKTLPMGDDERAAKLEEMIRYITDYDGDGQDDSMETDTEWLIRQYRSYQQELVEREGQK